MHLHGNQLDLHDCILISYSSWIYLEVFPSYLLQYTALIDKQRDFSENIVLNINVYYYTYYVKIISREEKTFLEW